MVVVLVGRVRLWVEGGFLFWAGYFRHRLDGGSLQRRVHCLWVIGQLLDGVLAYWWTFDGHVAEGCALLCVRCVEADDSLSYTCVIAGSTKLLDDRNTWLARR